MIQLSDMAVHVNDEAVAIVPNSLKFNEGQGEQTMRAASVGGGAVEQVYSHDVETSFGKVQFELQATPENIALARSWKTRENRNVVALSGETTEGTVTRTYTQAALLNDYDVEVGPEGNIPIEFTGNSPS